MHIHALKSRWTVPLRRVGEILLVIRGHRNLTRRCSGSDRLPNPRAGFYFVKHSNQLKINMQGNMCLLQVLDCQGSCDNSQLVSCSMDKSVVLWDVTSGNFSRKWRGHQVRQAGLGISTWKMVLNFDLYSPVIFTDDLVRPFFSRTLPT
jgi:hypothetical protein